ncbi:MAG TPA: excinuclease ABC subunit UvrC [Polyangiaceae bacterium]|nr:excinuclease ABC subunit UvrC [Polyangiaceae bacterium]HPY18872.1 excinuclease ABC subunit UvrC [Polyangiaceae bacterium]
MIPETLVSKLESLPSKPGCYLFKNAEGTVIYVGKATSLRSRVRSYFQQRSTDSRAQLPFLIRSVVDVETIITASEKEATILEDSLIKQHKPKYNVKLRDDKSYLSLRLDERHEYPRLELVRRPSADGARYFGPHHSATAARRTLHFINKHFHLRTCSDAELVSRKRPCLQYHIKRCPAPCVIDIDREHYASNVSAVMLFLEGRHDEVSAQVEQRMREASRRMDFELAAVYRDQLRAVQTVRETQRVVAIKDVDQDVIGLHRDADLCELALLFIRKGRVVDTATIPMHKVEVGDEEVIGAFLLHYYGEQGPAAFAIPDEVIVPVLPESPKGVQEWLTERRGRKVQLLHPQRGPRSQLLALAMDNAAHAFAEKRRAKDDVQERLLDLQRRLRLPTIPRVVECLDISHHAGKDTSGGLVRMVDGQFDTTGYRSYHVHHAAEGDDYAAIYDVLSRRFRRAMQQEQERSDEESRHDDPSKRMPWESPDLLVVDGGRGQLNVALAAARDLELHDLPIVGLAKERETVTGETETDRVYLPGQKNGITIRPHTALVWLARLRDEAHRFANSVRERKGKASRLHSQLEDIPGIGPVLRKRLLSEIGGPMQIREASDERLLAISGVKTRHLEALRKRFGRD